MSVGATGRIPLPDGAAVVEAEVSATTDVRTQLYLDGADEFEEIFELAENGKPFEVYSRTRLKRAK